MRDVFMSSGDAEVQKHMGLILRINWTPHMGQRLGQGGALGLAEPGNRHSCTTKVPFFPEQRKVMSATSCSHQAGFRDQSCPSINK